MFARGENEKKNKRFLRFRALISSYFFALVEICCTANNSIVRGEDLIFLLLFSSLLCLFIHFSWPKITRMTYIGITDVLMCQIYLSPPA